MALRISTRGRYALRVMIDLAEHNTGAYIPLKEIAGRQDISEKYLEGIIVTFSKAGYLIGQRGKDGGYRLAREPEQYTVGEVLRLVEGDLAPVACLAQEINTCPHREECRTIDMWERFKQVTDSFFDGITLSDLCQMPEALAE